MKIEETINAKVSKKVKEPTAEEYKEKELNRLDKEGKYLEEFESILNTHGSLCRKEERERASKIVKSVFSKRFPEMKEFSEAGKDENHL